MAKLQNASKPPFYKTGALYLHAEGHAAPDPSTKKDAKEKFDKDPTKHFKSFGTKKEQMNAKNPYPRKSERSKKFNQLQRRLKDSSM
jgi:predicted acyl esterase